MSAPDPRTAMHRSYKFLLRPTSKQATLLTEMLRDHCDLYNAALQERRDAYQHASRTRVSFYDQSAQLKFIRATDERHARWSSNSQTQTLRRLDKAFQQFFRRVRTGQAPGYPRFRGVNWFDTVDFREGNGAKWNAAPGRVRLQGVGHVRVHQHREVKGRVKQVSVKREGRRWYAIAACDQVPAELLPPTGGLVGIDLGVASLLTTSDGEQVENPRYGRRASEDLAAAQQVLSTFPRVRRDRQSARHRHAAERVARLHRKIGRQRIDHAHKTALRLVRTYDLIAHEDLQIKNMMKRAAAKPDGEGDFLPNGAAAKSGLNRSIHDAGWGVFLSILYAKAESAGRTLIAVDPRNTSRTCPECRHVAAENRISQAEFLCAACGHRAHADVNAAINILRSGLDLHAGRTA